MHMGWRNLAPVEGTFSEDTFQSNMRHYEFLFVPCYFPLNTVP